MRVPERRVGNQQSLLLPRPLRKLLLTHLEQELASSGSRRIFALNGRWRSEGQGRLLDVSLRLRVAVNNHIAEEIQQLRGAVTPRFEREQFRSGIDQRGRGLAGS